MDEHELFEFVRSGGKKFYRGQRVHHSRKGNGTVLKVLSHSTIKIQLDNGIEWNASPGYLSPL